MSTVLAARGLRLYTVVVRLIIVTACLMSIWKSARLVRADLLFQQDTAESLRSAIYIEPDAWEYYMRLAQLDRGHEPELLKIALSLNPFNAQADIELALEAEAAGNASTAEGWLLRAYAVDNSYVPRWSLASFYLRQGDINTFWKWARKAADMPTENLAALFELCWHVSNGPKEIEANIITDNPIVIRQYLSFLQRKDRLEGVGPIAERLLRVGTPSVDRSELLSVVNQLLAREDSEVAAGVWQSLFKYRWLTGDGTVPYNKKFETDPLPTGFDWMLLSYAGLHSWRWGGGLETEFTGGEPEVCIIAEQTAVLRRGNYSMEYAYDTSGIPADAGLRWLIVEAKSGAVVAESNSLSSEVDRREEVRFVVDRGIELLRLRLVYKRTIGTSRITGTLITKSVDIHAVSSR